jgi:hypothetical protein
MGPVGRFLSVCKADGCAHALFDRGFLGYGDADWVRQTALDVCVLIIVRRRRPFRFFALGCGRRCRTDKHAFAVPTPLVTPKMMRHIHTGQITNPLQILMLLEDAHSGILGIVPEMGRTLGIRQQVVEELVGILPGFVVFHDGVENLLLGAPFAYVLWIHDSGVNVTWVIVIYDDFIDAVNGGCAGDSSDLDGLVIRLLGV